MVNLGNKRSCGRDDVLIPNGRGSCRVHSIPQRSIVRRHRDTQRCNGVGCRDDGDVAGMGESILDIMAGPLDTGEASPISDEAIGDGAPIGVAG